VSAVILASGGVRTDREPIVVRPADDFSYSYLLGAYLGDGYVACTGRTYQLVVSLDAAFPQIVAECVEATVLALPTASPKTRRHRTHRLIRVETSSKAWPDLFPQMGPGRKHERPIVLAPWQRDIVERHTWQFIRGLIHSDGCRTVNRFSVRLPSGRVGQYAYPRYFFSNLSADIRRLLCDACERVGVRWTQSNHRNISISHRASVALLEEFVGPKT
jgi:hypothetical protein